TGSQFWTHGGGKAEHDIDIGAQCYIASAVRFAPGSGVGDRCVVALGAVVTKRFEASGVMLGGVPARVIKEHVRFILTRISP
ncbi:MAG: hypothetical protein D6819_04325, partial [Gammaproteobacteria bacterium]